MMVNTPDDARAALTRRRENGDVARSPVADDIRRMHKEFAAAMPSGGDPQRFIRDALTALRTVPKLDRCEPMSVLGALMTCAQLDLRVGVLGQAWPVPFYYRKQELWRAQLVIGYQGYSELAHRHPKVQSFIPRTVHEHDEFEIDYGVHGTLVHRPPTDGLRGKPIGYHSIARYTNGGYDFLYMSQAEMDEHRDRFATTRDKNRRIIGPWIDHPIPMGEKTVLRRLAKHIPRSARLSTAVAVDGGFRLDVEPLTLAEEVTEHPDVIDITPDLPAAADPPPSAEEMIKQIHVLADDLGMSKSECLAWLSDLNKRDIADTTELTDVELWSSLQAMHRYRDQSEPPS